MVMTFQKISYKYL
uniref:Uncharacterized protein n=1 Tax=Lepeophtheirus salmonis TaxID=72036 RepID=A0A0K2TNN3_LEPSM